MLLMLHESYVKTRLVLNRFLLGLNFNTLIYVKVKPASQAQLMLVFHVKCEAAVLPFLLVTTSRWNILTRRSF